MHGYIHPFLHTSSWRGNDLRIGITLPCETSYSSAPPLKFAPCNTVERNQRFGGICRFGFRVLSLKDNEPHRDKRFFFSAKHSGGLWHPPKLLSHRYRGGAHSVGKSGRGVKLTTLFHLVPRLRMSTVTPPLPIRLHDVHRDNYPTAGSSDTLTHTQQIAIQRDIAEQLRST